MNSLPVVLREMRVSARKPGLYWLRLGVALAGILAWCFIFLTGPARASAKGMALLVTLSVIAMILVLFSGVFLTSDCVSEEKREGTLGLLFLTPLAGHDVILGKMVANAAQSFFALLAIGPVLCLPLLTGGVTWGETVRVMIALLAALALSLSVGMLVSVLSTESRKAFIATLLALAALCAIPVLVHDLSRAFSVRKGPHDFLSLFSPVFTLIFSFDDNYRMFAKPLYWRSVLQIGVTVFLVLGTACALVRSSWRVRSSANSERACRRRGTGEEDGTQCSSKELAVLRPGPDLYDWLSFRGSALGMTDRTFLFVLSLFWMVMVVAAIATTEWRLCFMTAFFTAFAMHATAKFLFALEATRQVHQDVRSGNMELLLGTPLQPHEIVLGQGNAFRRRFRGLMRFLTGINLLMEMAVFVFADRLHIHSTDALMFSIFFLGGIVALHADFRAIQWVGVWRSLQAKTHLRAVFDTLRGIVGVPWILFPMAIAIAVNNPGRRGAESMALAVSIWFVVGLFLNLSFIGVAKRGLQTRFRELACTRGQ